MTLFRRKESEPETPSRAADQALTRPDQPRPAPTNPAEGIAALGDSLVRADEAHRNAPPIVAVNGQVLTWRSHWW